MTSTLKLYHSKKKFEEDIRWSKYIVNKDILYNQIFFRNETEQLSSS